MVVVPHEDRDKVTVMYIYGIAEYWWRGTGRNANDLSWHNFCRIVTDRYNIVSKKEIVGKFHNLKRVGFVIEYVDG